nr:ankyrin repeat domain-containing protein 53 isoform X2 [Geotrypetes seraphini]XP_033809226.1 ankyrin repeat domain-containing protein 53 isoform X2 [Geotrypetes seraphini]
MSKAGWRPIHLALNNKNRNLALNTVRYLIDNGAKVNVYGEGNVTPLHQAAREGLDDCIIVLIQAGADVNARNAEGHKPIDVCKIWCHRTSARYITNWMWRKDKENIAHEMQRLNKLKSSLQEAEQEMYKSYKKERDYQRKVAFNKWIEKKHLPQRLKLVPTYEKGHPSLSKATAWKDMDTIVTQKKMLNKGKISKHFYPEKETQKPILSETVKGQKEKPGSTSESMDILHEISTSDKQKRLQSKIWNENQMWNYSTKTKTPPAINIFRPTEVRLSTAPEETKEHDLGSYVFLSRDKQGKPKITAMTGNDIFPVPNLSFDIIKRNLFPDSAPPRIHMPQEFKATYVFDIDRKRSPLETQRTEPEIAFHLRETLDPKYIKETCKDDKIHEGDSKEDLDQR